jgi:hypothetical protein|nr:MAG TPA: hypothetical protein [Caudoviricetes sp.]
MDAKVLSETMERHKERPRELSMVKLSEPILIANKEKKVSLPVWDFKDLLWLPIGTLIHADGEYFMKKSTAFWTSTLCEESLSTEKLFSVFASLTADEFPICFIFIPDTNKGV